jgi:hypothetical protein
MRQIIDMPRPLLRMTQVTWDIDWGGQGGNANLRGGDQVVVSRFPRFTASLQLTFERDGIGQWRAFRSRLRGQENAARIRMIDPPTMQSVGSGVDVDWAAFLSGGYVEPRPQVSSLAAVAAGATSIQIDETTARAPIPPGAHLSYGDWPFQVLDRSGSGAAVTLEVTMLRTAIPLNGQIDLIPRGLFIMADPSQGAASYGRRLRTAPEVNFMEWITRS